MKKCIVFFCCCLTKVTPTFCLLNNVNNPPFPHAVNSRPTARWERSKIVSGVLLHLLYSPLIPMTALM